MAKHYVRDAYVQGPTGSYQDSTTIVQSMVNFHMLRLGGAKWLWECDGAVGPYDTSANHVVDGNMDAAGVADWTQVSTADLSKDTSESLHGSQSLKVTSKALGGGVESSALLAMRAPNTTTHTASHTLTYNLGYMQLWKNSGFNYHGELTGARINVSGCTNPGNNGTFPISEWIAWNELHYFNPSGVSEVLSGSVVTTYERRYEVVIWAKNDSGVAWDVKVDPGTGVLATVGTIPSDGTFQMYHFSFWCTGSGSCYVRVVDPSWSSDHTIYIDGILVFRSLFEYFPNNVYGTGGSTTGVDTFNTGVAAASTDLGKFIMFWDAAHPENTGCYEIVGVVGADYQLDLRSGTAVFTPSTGLDWRMVDLVRSTLSNADMDAGDVGAYGGVGFGVETPHSSKWRYFCRMYSQPTYDNRGRYFVNWASPKDEDFDISSGHFYDYSHTTLVVSGGYRRWDKNQFIWNGYHTSSTAVDSSGRLYFMADDDLSFFTFFCRTYNGVDPAIVVGMSGADLYHPGEEEFIFFCPFPTSLPFINSAQVGFDGNTDRCVSIGVSFTPTKVPVLASCGVLGYGTSVSAVITAGNACPNPFSLEEHIDPLYILRDPTGVDGWYSERDFTKGIYMGRENFPNFQTFDSDNFLHFRSGWIWEWNGVSVLP